MDYFVISQDSRIPNLVEPVGLTNELINQATLDEYTPLQLNIKPKEYSEYVDFIERPLPLIADQLKQLLQQMENGAAFAPVILADLPRGEQHLYWQLNPPKVECLSKQTEFNKNGTIKKLVLNPFSASRFRLFQVDLVLERYLVANLIVVESMLRRNLTGFKLTRVELETGQVD